MTASFAPIIVTIEFHITDGEQIAKASFECPVGELPTCEDVEVAAGNVLKQVRSQLGDNFHWQSRHDFVSEAMAQMTGGVRLAVPGPDRFAADWANNG